MKPDNNALQVFYGTVPLILIVGAAWMRESMLLKDILGRLKSIEDRLLSIESRLTTLEVKAWH